MASCFQRTNPNLSCSDYSRRRGDKTVYRNIRNNIRGNVPQKTGNKPGSVNYDLCKKVGTIKSTMDYETRMQIQKGENLTDYTKFDPCKDYYYGLFGGNSRIVQKPNMKLIQDYRIVSQTSTTFDTKLDGLIDVEQGFWTDPSTTDISQFVCYPKMHQENRGLCRSRSQLGKDPLVSMANKSVAYTSSATAINNRLFGFSLGPVKNIIIPP